MTETPTDIPRLRVASNGQHGAAGAPEDPVCVHVESYPAGAKFVVPMFAVCLIFIVIGIDSTIVAIAVPSLTAQFGTIADMGWYLSIYRLTSGTFQPLFGKLYSILPAKMLVIPSLLVFMSGSVLSALSYRSPIFILARAVAGFATAGITSGAFAIIIQLTPVRSRSKYASIGAATEAVAALTAPILGGVLIDRLSWRWCFYIELPFLAAASILLLIVPRSPATGVQNNLGFSTLLRNVELYSTAVMMSALTCLLLALRWGGNQYAWTDYRVTVPLGLFVGLASVYVLLQFRLGDRATMPKRILARRSVLFGFLFAACNNGALSVIEYYLPSYFQVVGGNSATMAGILILPLGLGLIVSISLAGFLTYYAGFPNPFMILNGIMTPIATGLLTTVHATPETWKLLVYQALLGFGTGIGFQGPQVAVQAILSDSDSHIGLSIIQLAQALGPAVFVAAAQTVFASKLPSGFAMAQESRAESASPMSDHSSLYIQAFGATFFVAVGLAFMTLVGSLGMEWRSIKRKSTGPGIS